MKNLKSLFMYCCLLGCFFTMGCVFFTKDVKILQKIEIGMSKDQVRQMVGEPVSVRGAIRNKEGQVVEVWTYILKRPGPHHNENYWLRFVDGKLVQWGQDKDWQREPDYIEKKIFDDETLNKPGLL